MKILIVKLGSIGDIVHTLPTLATIREAIPQAEISWAVEKRSAEILRGNALIDHLIEVDTRSIRGKTAGEILPEITSQIKELRKFKFDVAIDFQGLLKSGMIAKLSGAKQRWGFSRKDLREPASRIFLTKTVQISPQTHIIRKNLKLAGAALNIQVPNETFKFPIFTTDEHKAEASYIVEQAAGEFAVLNPAGGWVTKLWHAEKFGQLADKIYEKYGMVSVVATGPNEDSLAETVLKNSRSGKIILTQPSLKGFYELARKAKIYVGGDTGPTHLAVAVGAPVVGLFGPTEWWRNGSPNAGDICVERVDIACRVDCHRRTCGNWICMDTDVDTVFAAVNRRLAV
jgi:lipopolysaccharide heptosyltransferase I